MSAPDVAKLREEFKEPHELVKMSDGKTIFVRHWVGSSEDGLAILIFHGITGYSEPYGKMLAEELSAAGFEVFGMDLRGHGRSDGVRGDYPSADRLSKDLCETVSFLKGKFSKVVVLGHSEGALRAVIVANSCPADVDGLILLSVGKSFRPGAYDKPPASVALKSLLGVTLFPGSRLIEYRRRGMLGKDDPLFNFQYTARFYSYVYGMSALSVVRMRGRNVIESPNMTISARRDIPVLVGVGDQDELFSVDSARAFFESIGSGPKEFMVIPRGHHAAFPPGSWSQLTAWLRKSYLGK